MAKRAKTTLSDLNKFLHKEPNKLTEVEKLSLKDIETVDMDVLLEQVEQLSKEKELSVGQIILELAERSLDAQKDLSASELMLLNTVIYLRRK